MKNYSIRKITTCSPASVGLQPVPEGFSKVSFYRNWLPYCFYVMKQCCGRYPPRNFWFLLERAKAIMLSTRKNQKESVSIIGPSNFLQKIAVGTMWYGIRLIFRYWLTLEYRGIQNLPVDEPYLLAANHSSHLDSVTVSLSLGEHVTNIYSLGAKDYFAGSPFKQWFFSTFFYVIPFNRRGNFIAGLRHCQSLITPKTPILLFPEGTRSVTGKIQSFKKGLGFMALNFKVPIVPVYISGTFQSMPKGSHLPRKQHLQVIYGKPIDIKTYLEKQSSTDKDIIYNEIGQKTYAAVKDLQAGLNQKSQ